jgi:hypothetical protein
MKKIFLSAVLVGLSASAMDMKKAAQAEKKVEIRDWFDCMFRENTSQADLVEAGRIGFGQVDDVARKAAKIENRVGYSDSRITFGKKYVLLSDNELSAFTRKTTASSASVDLVTEKKDKYMNWYFPSRQVEATLAARLNENLKQSRLCVALESGPQKVANKQAVIDPQARLQLSWLGKVVVFVQHGDKSQTFTLSEQALELLQTKLELSDDGIEMRVEKAQQASPGVYSDEPAVADKFFVHKNNASVIEYQPRYVFWRNIIAGGGASLLAALAVACAYFHSK